MIDPDLLARTFAHLPVAKGGMGWTEQAQVARVAYDASIAAASRKNGAAMALKQSALMLSGFEDLARWIDNLKIAGVDVDFALHRKMNSLPGTAAIFTTANVRARVSAWSAMMRFRMISPLAGAPTHMSCCGCSKTMSPREFLLHAPSCPRAKGFNTSSRHAALKNELKQVAHENGVQCESQEPRDLRLVICPGCKEEVMQATFDVHTKSCKHFNPMVMPLPNGHGPDIRFYGLSQTGMDATNVDVTTVSAEAPSNAKKSLLQCFKEREATSNRSLRGISGCA